MGNRKGLDKKGGGVSRYSVENFLSHTAEIFRRGILYCCTIFGNRKGLDKREGGFQGIPSKISCLTVPKSHVGESFTVALISGREKVYGTEERGDYQDFPLKFFCLTVPNIS